MYIYRETKCWEATQGVQKMFESENDSSWNTAVEECRPLEEPAVTEVMKKYSMGEKDQIQGREEINLA